MPHAVAERMENRVAIRWTGLANPVSIFRIDGERRLLGEGFVDMARVEAAPWPRPYFLLRDANGVEIQLAERLLPLDGGVNFRDMGGYRAGGDARVKWGLLYRSAVMSRLSDEDFRRLSALGIRTVCDLRSSSERLKDVVNWPGDMQPVIQSRDYHLAMESITDLPRDEVTADRVVSAMSNFYAELPFEFAPQLSSMMQALAQGQAPLAFNCSAGKDRTGFAAALILSVLDVPRETVMADYLLTREFLKPRPPSPDSDDPTVRMYASLPREIWQMMMGVEEVYLQAAFDAIDGQGGMERYYRDDLKLSPATIQDLRQSYTG